MFAKKEGLKEAMAFVNQNFNACSKITGDLGLKLCVDPKENGEGTLCVKTPSTKLSGYIRNFTYGGKVNEACLFSLALSDSTLNLFVGTSFVKAVVFKKNDIAMDKKTLNVCYYVDEEGKIVSEDYVVSSYYGNSWRYENGNNHLALVVNDCTNGSKSVHHSNSIKDNTLLTITTSYGKNTGERIDIGRSEINDNYHTLVNGEKIMIPNPFDEASAIANFLIASKEVQSVKDEVTRAFAEFIANPELVFNSNALLTDKSNTSKPIGSPLSFECYVMSNELSEMFMRMHNTVYANRKRPLMISTYA